jgi:hypothetical protein
MRDDIPENKVSELTLWTGLAVPAPPFAQRDMSKSLELAVSKLSVWPVSSRSAVAQLAAIPLAYRRSRNKPFTTDGCAPNEPGTPVCQKVCLTG